MQQKQSIIVYKTKTGAIELRGDFARDTIWATQSQIADVFDIDRSVATKHIRNILTAKEIAAKSNVQKMHIAGSDKPVALYSLDMILAVGYRANSARAIIFRKWATKTLRAHIIEGYTINKSRLAQNYEVFMKAITDVRSLLPKSSSVSTESVLELITFFADTWLSLNAFDTENFPAQGTTKKKVTLTAKKLAEDIELLKADLMEKGEATELFASERAEGSIGGIVGNVMQSFEGKVMYPTIEEKAAHLLYFMVKDHPFVDGNKRTGAYAFIWFLRSAGILDVSLITPMALTVLTLLIAESNPKDKEKMTSLIVMLLLGRNKNR